MALAFLLDENLPASLWRAIRRRNITATDTLDVVRVGEISDLPLSTSDEQILIWAEDAERILITQDKNTMPGHLENHLASGRHSPGVFMLRPACSIPSIIEFLELANEASMADEWQDRVTYVP